MKTLSVILLVCLGGDIEVLPEYTGKAKQPITIKANTPGKVIGGYPVTSGLSVVSQSKKILVVSANEPGIYQLIVFTVIGNKAVWVETKIKVIPDTPVALEVVLQDSYNKDGKKGMEGILKTLSIIKKGLNQPEITKIGLLRHGLETQWKIHVGKGLVNTKLVIEDSLPGIYSIDPNIDLTDDIRQAIGKQLDQLIQAAEKVQ